MKKAASISKGVSPAPVPNRLLLFQQKKDAAEQAQRDRFEQARYGPKKGPGRPKTLAEPAIVQYVRLPYSLYVRLEAASAGRVRNQVLVELLDLHLPK